MGGALGGVSLSNHPKSVLLSARGSSGVGIQTSGQGEAWLSLHVALVLYCVTAGSESVCKNAVSCCTSSELRARLGSMGLATSVKLVASVARNMALSVPW